MATPVGRTTLLGAGVGRARPAGRLGNVRDGLAQLGLRQSAPAPRRRAPRRETRALCAGRVRLTAVYERLWSGRGAVPSVLSRPYACACASIGDGCCDHVRDPTEFKPRTSANFGHVRSAKAVVFPHTDFASKYLVLFTRRRRRLRYVCTSKSFSTKDVLGKNCAYVGAKYSSQYLHLNKMCETTRNLLEILDQPVFESLL